MARGVSVVGTLPQGFPPFDIPRVSVSDILCSSRERSASRWSSLVDTISTSSAFAARTGQGVRANQEMIGIGAANVAAGFFQGFPVSTSGSRTAVAEQAGDEDADGGGGRRGGHHADPAVRARDCCSNLPQPTLAAVVIAASFSLADIPGATVCRRRRTEFALSIAAFLAVVLLGVLPGIAIAVALSI